MHLRRIAATAIAVAMTATAVAAGAVSAGAAPDAAPLRFHADASSSLPVQDQLTAALARGAAAGRPVVLPGRVRVTRTMQLPPRSTLRMAAGAAIVGAIPGQSLVRLTSGSSLIGGKVVNRAASDCFDVDFADRTNGATVSGVRFGGARTNSVYLNAVALRDIEIRGNRFDGVVYGVLLNSGARRSADIRVTDNVFTRISADAIEFNSAVAQLKDRVSHVQVTGNTVERMRGSGDGSGFAVGLAGVRAFRVTRNRITGARSEALHIEAQSTSGVVAQNLVVDGGVGYRPAVAIYRTVSSVVVRNNTVRGFHGDGIAVLWDAVGSSRSIRIERNLVDRVTGSGVVVGGDQGTGPFVVKANDIRSPRGFGVVVLGTHRYSVVEGNLIRQAGSAPISVRYRGDGERRFADNGLDLARLPRAGADLP